ncbi:UvrD-helicase domain-containing protein [Fusobacterium pseudoperiodonticum]|uniref:UvrD-helicase domain-containing protein n=1 Tax=Fusobacterium pseudoperiodonticum TaxID=2663009 RepID=UPI000C1B8E05|nr:UvrD-helicase domain-containing protein [Fusobacterium pseudoperiodonticum]ATV63972.1 LexA repressor [Fusobacterium pseudoperiodonticum]
MSEIILSNEQISVARYPENGVIRVNGGPGSGKTLVAVKRAIFLAKDYKYAEKDDKVLFLFYNKSLERTIKKLFESEKDYEKVKDKIEIRSIDSFFVKEYINANNQEFFAYVKKANNDKDFVTSYDKERKERIENILLAKKEELKKFSPEDAEFVLSEIDWLRNCCYMKKEEYLEITRYGRGNQKKLQKEEKEEIYRILNLYRGGKKDTLRYTDFYDIAFLFLYYFEKEENRNKVKKYNHVIVDEAQDLSKIHFRFINLICEISKTSGNTISLFMDKNQSIYPEQAWIFGNRTLKQVGININKSFTLNRAYRNVKEIFDVAKKLNPEVEVGDVPDTKNQNLTLTFSVDRGIKPFFIKYSDSEDRLNNLCKDIKTLVNEFNYKYDDISIICLNEQSIKEIQNSLQKEHISYVKKNKIGEGINITTYHSAKGTENKIIFIPNIDELNASELTELYPDKTKEEILEELKKLLYIGMTRATEVLIVSSLKIEPSEYQKKLLEIFDFKNDFINIDTDFDDFYSVFNKEINKNENIEKNHSKFFEIKEVVEEEKASDVAIQKEIENLKPDKNEKNIDNKEIENEIETKFPSAHKSTKIGLVKAEKLFLRADKNDDYFGSESFEYLKSLECEIRTYYATIQEKVLNESYSKSEKLSTILNKLKDYSEFKTPVHECYKYKVFNERNDLAHDYSEYTYDDLLEIRELVKEKLLPKFIKASKKFKTNKGIDEFIVIGKLETSYNKIDIKKKKYYTYYIKDENNNEFPALSENRYEQNINYKLIVNKLMLKGNEYYRILEANNFSD